MCGRYALGIRAAYVRYQLQQQGLPVDDAPQDDEARETFNFPPGSFGLVYRADVPDHGVRDDEPSEEDQTETSPTESSQSYKYHLKVMKWGLIPFWTKRQPDYGSMLRTINCRDDSLAENRGMWNTMKQRKRCLVIAQGFYEWLKKDPGGKDKIPHFVKRKDGNLMCFAGLWDCVKYEDSEDKHYTYSIITTDSNKQLAFLHDRMPVILEPGSDDMKMWLDPTRNKWSKELQSMLKPYNGQLECYPVNKEVGKVGNNSPDFVLPVNSKENKKNIANFFENAKTSKLEQKEQSLKTTDQEGTENNAPLPVPQQEKGQKRGAEEFEEKSPKAAKIIPTSKSTPSPNSTNKRVRSATSNNGATLKSSPKKTAAGNQRITNFFVK